MVELPLYWILVFLMSGTTGEVTIFDQELFETKQRCEEAKSFIVSNLGEPLNYKVLCFKTDRPFGD